MSRSMAASRTTWRLQMNATAEWLDAPG